MRARRAPCPPRLCLALLDRHTGLECRWAERAEAGVGVYGRGWGRQGGAASAQDSLWACHTVLGERGCACAGTPAGPRGGAAVGARLRRAGRASPCRETLGMWAFS